MRCSLHRGVHRGDNRSGSGGYGDSNNGKVW